MLTPIAIAEVAALVGEPARSVMLVALMDGRALTATELADAAGITPQTASSHLSRMTEAGLLALERQGRHRYHRLASAEVGAMIEAIMAVAADPGRPARRGVRTGPRDAALRQARSCYDHLAGRVAVAIADDLGARGFLASGMDGPLSEAGADFLASVGVDVASARTGVRGRRAFCRPCLDWSERRPHLAGALGAALFCACLDRGWMRRTPGSRAVTITRAGAQALETHFGVRAEAL